MTTADPTVVAPPIVRAPSRTLVVDLREGERIPVATSFFVVFGLVAGNTILETARDALFLGLLEPSRLTFVYLAVAVLGLVIAPQNARFVRSFGRRNALIVTLVIGAIGTTLLYFRASSPALAFGLYVWSALLSSISVVQFWLVASEMFTSSQSKRLFPVISAGGVIGAVAGSGLAILVLTFLPVRSLLLVSVGTFMATALIVTFGPSEVRSVARETKEMATRQGMALLKRQPYLVRVALFVAFSTLALLTLDYLFKTVAAQSFAPKDLGKFFARYYAVLNGASLVMQLVVAGRLVRRLGVVVALSLLPLVLIGGAALSIMFAGSLWVLLLTKGADGSLRYSVHRVATELLYVPLDASLRDRVKPLLDSVLGRVMQAAAAGGLLLLTLGGLGSPNALALLVAIFSVAWVVVAISLRRPYLDLFRQSLGKGLIDPAFRLKDLDLSSAEAVIEALSSPEPARAIAAMNLLADARRTRLIPALILYHESEAVLLRALEVVPEEKRRDWIPLVERLLSHPSPAVHFAAVRALGRFGNLPTDVAEPSGALRAYLAVERVRRNPDIRPEDDPDIRAILDAGCAGWHDARLALLNAIVDDPHSRWVDTVERLGCETDTEMLEASARAMAALRDERFIPTLIQRLPERRARTAVREALIAFGSPALEKLGSALRDPSTERALRVNLPRAIAEFGTQRAGILLLEALESDAPGYVRFRVLRALGRLVAERRVRVARGPVEAEIRRNLIEYLRLGALLLPLEERPHPPARARASGRLVEGLIRDKMRQARERVFRLLGLIHRSEDLRGVYFALESEDRRVRANALEFIEALTLRSDEELRTLLRLMVDDMKLSERIERAAAFVDDPPSLEAALRQLMEDSDDALATLAAHHVRDLGLAALADDAERVLCERTWVEFEQRDSTGSEAPRA